MSAQDLNPKPIEETPATFVLEIITYVGLAISIIGLLLTIITYLVVRYDICMYFELPGF